VRAAQGRRREQGGPVAQHPLDHGREPELDGLRHAVGVQPGHDVAVHVPADGAPGRDAAHLKPVRPPVLIPVAGRRHDDQPLPQRFHRRVVLVAKALLDDVGDAPGGVEVQHVVIEQGRPQDTGIQHHQAVSPARAAIRPVTRVKPRLTRIRRISITS
jgi:hypothetical protein